jgi:hypothetical protein
MVAKLSDAPPPATVAHVLSPLRYVVASLVPDWPNLETGTVPLPRFVAFKAVRFIPLAAGSVAGNCASGIVPLVSWVALSAVKLIPELAGNVAGNLASGIVPLVNWVALSAVILAPPPLKLVAVSRPESLMLAELTLIVVPLVPLYLTIALST